MIGLAQVNGLRGDKSVEERVKCAIAYIEEWTWMLGHEKPVEDGLWGIYQSGRKEKTGI